MSPRTESPTTTADPTVNLFPYPPQRSRRDLPGWIPVVAPVEEVVHLHACRPGALNSNDVFVAEELRNIGVPLTALHGMTQPGYSVARHMAELLSGLPVTAIDDLATRMLTAMEVDAGDAEKVCEFLSTPAEEILVPPGGFGSLFGVVSNDQDAVPLRLDSKLLQISQDAVALTGRAVGVTFARHEFQQEQVVDSRTYTAAVSEQLGRLRRRDNHAFRELLKRFGSIDQLLRSSRVQHHVEIVAAKTGRGGSGSLWGQESWLQFALAGRLDSPARLLMLGVRAEEFARHSLAAEGAVFDTAADAVGAAAETARALDAPLVVQEFMRAGDYAVYEEVRDTTGATLAQAPICAWDSETHPDFMVGVLELVRRASEEST